MREVEGIGNVDYGVGNGTRGVGAVPLSVCPINLAILPIVGCPRWARGVGAAGQLCLEWRLAITGFSALEFGVEGLTGMITCRMTPWLLGCC